MVGSGPLFVRDIQQVVAAAVLSITTMYRGLRLVDRPIYFERQGLPAAEFILRGSAPNGAPASCWYGLLMAGRRYFYVFSIAQPANAPHVEQDARALFKQLQF